MAGNARLRLRLRRSLGHREADELQQKPHAYARRTYFCSAELNFKGQSPLCVSLDTRLPTQLLICTTVTRKAPSRRRPC
jgi:hypothetical protein